MNKESIKLDNNTYAVINETGDTRIVSTINSNDEETIKKYFKKKTILKN